jgi:hypothetical protein
MAQRRKVVLVDDLDGGRADQTVTFSLDGQLYEIDLSSANRQRLREIMAPFAAAARKTAGNRSADRQVASTSANPPEPAPPVTVPTEREAVAVPADLDRSTPRRAVPAALFSSRTEYQAPRSVPAARPPAVDLFNPGG